MSIAGGIIAGIGIAISIFALGLTIIRTRKIGLKIELYSLKYHGEGPEIPELYDEVKM